MLHQHVHNGRVGRSSKSARNQKRRFLLHLSAWLGPTCKRHRCRHRFCRLRARLPVCVRPLLWPFFDRLCSPGENKGEVQEKKDVHWIWARGKGAERNI